MPSVGFLLAGSRHAKMRVAGFAFITVAGTEQRLRIDIFLGEHVVDVADFLD